MIFSAKWTQPVVKFRQMEFLSTNVSEHNVGGLPCEQAAENVWEAKIQNGHRWPILDLIIF